MSKTVPLAEMLAKNMKDPAFAAAYAEADAEYSVIEAMISARAEAGLTQEALAERMGTTQSAIARLEGGRVSPSVETLRKYAKAVGKRLRVEMV
ncbi:MAG: helix-turn-helix transcriptional regulator [Cypionkella sp.]|uniref:helix-turn-helix domain-containing protein n=1 Tax=Cypionkella sp. TaxID=2811411 RepID=UPI002ABC88EB|nr:helix-turn-helix transcriptional regulator [Cypionkella sp.]MDZ4312613.1 helix-turn-helix transcriptional regulator [Cypionkella sp.]